jgi:hypothetical protein
VLGALLALAILGAAAVIVTRDTGTGEADGATTTTASTGSTIPGSSTTVPASDRIGTSVAGIDLLTGDCLNFDQTGGNIDTFDIAACDAPHAVEITAQAEHPAATGEYPGVDELARFATERCGVFTDDYIGADIYDTTLDQSALTPDFNDWSGGLYRVSCTVQRVDGQDLTESVAGIGTTYSRGADVPVFRLKLGDCFTPATVDSALNLGSDDSVVLAGCGAAHTGIFFGRGQLPFGYGQPYPGLDAVDDAAIGLCDQQFTSFFGTPSTGFDYRYWIPTEVMWATDDRSVLCAVLDDRGLPSTLDYPSYLPVYDVASGQCFSLPPGRTADQLGLDDRVATADCNTEFHGQLFGAGELPDGAYPGDESVDTSSLNACYDRFAEFVGRAYTDSSLDFVYWAPTETSWSSGSRRYACVFLSDTASTGSFEGIAI